MSDKRTSVQSSFRHLLARKHGTRCPECRSQMTLDGGGQEPHFALMVGDGENMRLLCRRCARPMKGTTFLKPDFAAVARDFDALPVDGVLRVKNGEACPNRQWFRVRAALRGFVIAQHSFHPDHIVLRIR